MIRKHRLLLIIENPTTPDFSPLSYVLLHFSHQTSNSNTNGMTSTSPRLVINTRIFSKPTRIGK